MRRVRWMSETSISFKNPKVVTFKVEQDLLELLDRYALKYGLNRSEAIRKAIEKAIQEELSKETVPLARVEKIKM
ncbi:hypothetical protein IC007_1830 [Sulfuracidifex tepidarius]|uniref:Ribbon-helix-helix protein CopG domain-containing protein n=2 Tax=Sulfuracidifex tepidarius TaxID=1294262 RepID=A0A510E448_9CREN|nr:hypothetical protein IC007_1830 [Sulfuracidifex tepidarius]